MVRSAVTAASILLLARASTTQAQAGGFVATLGSDTIQVEQFQRTGDRVVGTVAFRSPTARLARYQVELAADGRINKYQQNLFKPDGTRIEPNPANATMTFTADSVIRETVRGSEPSPSGWLCPTEPRHCWAARR